MRDVILKKEPVELHKILKFEGLVPSGGVAKMASPKWRLMPVMFLLTAKWKHASVKKLLAVM